MKWEDEIIKYLFKNGKTNFMTLKNNIEDDKKKKISSKVLFTVLKRLEEKEIIEKIETTEKVTIYDISKLYKTEEISQLFYLSTIPKDNICSDTITYHHSIYGLPSFDKLTEYEKITLSSFIEQIDDILKGIAKLKNKEDIRIQTLISRLATVIYLILENEERDKQIKFIDQLVKNISNLGREFNLDICSDNGTKSPYPEKFFHQYYEPYKKIMKGKPSYSKKPKQNIVLISTVPINKVEIVKNNIGFAITSVINESLFTKKKYDDKLAIDNIERMAEIIWAGRKCKNGKWVYDDIYVNGFKFHRELNSYFSEEEIKFMLRLIKALTKDNKYSNIGYDELEQFIIYQGFETDKGLWYNADIYNRAKEIFKKIKWDEYNDLPSSNRLQKIKENVDEIPLDPNTNKLILYLEAKGYFEKIRPNKSKEKDISELPTVSFFP